MSTHMPERWTFTPAHFAASSHEREKQSQCPHMPKKKEPPKYNARREQTTHEMWCIRKTGLASMQIQQNSIRHYRQDSTRSLYNISYTYTHIFLLDFGHCCTLDSSQISSGSRTRDTPGQVSHLMSIAGEASHLKHNGLCLRQDFYTTMLQLVYGGTLWRSDPDSLEMCLG